MDDVAVAEHRAVVSEQLVEVARIDGAELGDAVRAHDEHVVAVDRIVIAPGDIRVSGDVVERSLHGIADAGH